MACNDMLQRTGTPLLCDGERQRIADNAYVNDKSVGTAVRVLYLKRLHVEIVAKTREGVFMVDVMPSLGDDNRRHSRAKKLADRIAASMFKFPVMVAWHVRGVPVFRYRGRLHRKRP